MPIRKISQITALQSEQMTGHLEEQTMKQVISVGDQESDIYEDLHYINANISSALSYAPVVECCHPGAHSSGCFRRRGQRGECLGCKSVRCINGGKSLPVKPVRVQKVGAPVDVKPRSQAMRFSMG